MKLCTYIFLIASEYNLVRFKLNRPSRNISFTKLTYPVNLGEKEYSSYFLRGVDV